MIMDKNQKLYKLEQLVKEVHCHQDAEIEINTAAVMQKINEEQKLNQESVLERMLWHLVPVCCVCLVFLFSADLYLESVQQRQTNLALMNQAFELNIVDLLSLG
jgi:broad-specificity NMP kinase